MPALRASTQAVSAPTILSAPGRTRSPCQRSSWLEVQLSTMWIAFDWCELKQDVSWPMLARKNLLVKSKMFIRKMILVGSSWIWSAGYFARGSGCFLCSWLSGSWTWQFPAGLQRTADMCRWDLVGFQGTQDANDFHILECCEKKRLSGRLSTW